MVLNIWFNILKKFVSCFLRSASYTETTQSISSRNLTDFFVNVREIQDKCSKFFPLFPRMIASE